MLPEHCVVHVLLHRNTSSMSAVAGGTWLGVGKGDGVAVRVTCMVLAHGQHITLVMIMPAHTHTMFKQVSHVSALL